MRLRVGRFYSMGAAGGRDGENHGSSDSGIDMLNLSVSNALVVPVKIYKVDEIIKERHNMLYCG
jgi:hypothetical protein